jgi:hypothetical protein
MAEDWHFGRGEKGGGGQFWLMLTLFVEDWPKRE